MRVTWQRVALLVAALFLVAAVSNQPYRYEKPLGFQTLANPSNAAPTVPTGTRHVEIWTSVGAVLYTDNGTAPTGTVGVRIPANAGIKKDNDPGIISALRFRCSTRSGDPGTCTVDLNYYGDK